MWMGTVLFTGVIWFFILFVFIFWLYYERIICAEEVFLREKFGNNYLNWAEKTPIFIPNKLSYDHPIMTFNWKKIIIKEKTGLLMLFLVFFGFQLFSGFVITNFLVVEFNFITHVTIFSFVFYIIVKTMQSSKLFSVE